MRNRARSDADYKVKNWDRHSQVNLFSVGDPGSCREQCTAVQT